jgi:hypothetical protein
VPGYGSDWVPAITAEEVFPDGPKQERHPWDRLPNEPMLWFNRFEIFRSLGPENRSVINAWRQLGNPNNAKAPSSVWKYRAKEWYWWERAEAYDEWNIHQRRQRFQDEMDAQVLDARHARRALLTNMIAASDAAVEVYNRAVGRIMSEIDELETKLDTVEDSDQKENIKDKILSLSRMIMERAPLADIARTMELAVKQARVEFGDIISEDKATARSDESSSIVQENVLHVVVHD